MLLTIKHQDVGIGIVFAKLMTDYLKVTHKIANPEQYIVDNQVFDANFVAYVTTWQSQHGLIADGVIGPDTWRTIAKVAPTCSTSKNKASGYTMALQLRLGSNLTCDGVFGERTKNAVVVFQDAHGLNADGVCGSKTWYAMIVGDEPTPTPTPTPGKFTQPVDYKQADPRWGKKNYTSCGNKSQTMANSGCGPTAAADVVATLKDPSVTPWTLAQLSMQLGCRTKSSGTSWDFFKKVAAHYGFSKFVQTKSIDALKACLDAGGYVVCSMGPGYWTKGGHYICAWSYDKTYIYCNDPASTKRKKQKLTDFMKERKQFFCFYPDGVTGPFDQASWTGDEEIHADPVEPPVPEIEVDLIQRGDKICDISKYQPKIDYDAFIADTAVIILRAGYRGTAGGVHEDQKFELHASELIKRGVRFGVYFFSIATDEAKAREEARAFYQYANGYNPLFWAMDAENASITTAAIVAFVDELRKLGAVKVGCYCANHLYAKYKYDTIRDKMDFTWIPRYSTTPPKYKCDMWQYTSTGKVNGISGKVDLSKITGEGHPLEWFCE